MPARLPHVERTDREISVLASAILATALLCCQAAAQTPANPPAPAGSLSDRLEKSDGIIKPPADVDPKIAKPAPEPHPNSTPVIPPPGSPGGRRDLDPK